MSLTPYGHYTRQPQHRNHQVLLMLWLFTVLLEVHSAFNHPAAYVYILLSFDCGVVQ